jgi:hypothetical protein
MAMVATMTPNGNEDNKNQVAMAARVMTMVARAMVTGGKRETAMLLTMATMPTMVMMVTTAMMMPNSKDDTSGNKGNEDTNQ